MGGQGALIVVGCGIQMGRHVSERCVSEIRLADAVVGLVDAFSARWLADLRPDFENLGRFYGDDKDRRESYREMQDAVLAPVRAGKRVCAVFYGHPGVFAQVPHVAIATARAEGFEARMEPGISAEACLYADLGLDPGARGVQSFEATQFLINRRRIDPSAMLILWQVALAGKLDCIGFEPEPARLRVLVEKLRHWYEPDTEVILYEAAQLVIEDFRAERLPLRALPDAAFKEYTTLVIEPAAELEADTDILKRLELVAGNCAR
ncbi:MAG: SAM-dependent methyltransferase [Wenzhouxiangellaceae bacterium]|nr:SAM-dependent methyltransferase [Wenzhouxiangellaceae bacterium]